jgi:hypothetical protein
MSAQNSPINSTAQDQVVHGNQVAADKNQASHTSDNSVGSYVDDYQPPQVKAPTQSTNPSLSYPDPISASSQEKPADVSALPDVTAPNQNKPTTAPAATDKTESLASQNIFFLLGVGEGSDEDRESFLDELQQVVWEDFLENDVKLLLETAQMQELQTIMKKGDSPEIQEEMVVMLEKHIPDLEEIMLEKALELKEDLVRERVAGLREYYKGKPNQDAVYAQLAKVEQLFNQDKWHSGAEMLNNLKH